MFPDSKPSAKMASAVRGSGESVVPLNLQVLAEQLRPARGAEGFGDAAVLYLEISQRRLGGGAGDEHKLLTKAAVRSAPKGELLYRVRRSVAAMSQLRCWGPDPRLCLCAFRLPCR